MLPYKILHLIGTNAGICEIKLNVALAEKCTDFISLKHSV